MALMLEEVEEMWLADGAIDKDDLIGESIKIPKLHAQYHKRYCDESLRLSKLKADYSILIKQKTEYYSGNMDPLEMKNLGWQPVNLRILKQDISNYIEADKDVIQLSLKINYRTQVVKFLEDIVKQINSRNFILKTISDWARFTNGGI